MSDGMTTIEINLPEDTIYELALLAHERDITLNALINEILTEYIEKYAPKPNTWTTTIEDINDGTGDGLLTLPPELLEKTGWGEGDTLNIDIDLVTGSIILSKKKEDDVSTEE